MLSINLLPKGQKSAALSRQVKSAGMMIAYTLSGVMVLIAAGLFFWVMIFQKNQINDLGQETETTLAKLPAEQDTERILTLQNQLIAIPQLHNNKAVSSRLFDYLDKVVPVDVTLTEISVSFNSGSSSSLGSTTAEGLDGGIEGGATESIADETGDEQNENQISMSGITKDYESMNIFADILKNAEFRTKSWDATSSKEGDSGLSETRRAFKNVVVTSSSVDDSSTYRFAFKIEYDPLLFDFDVKQVEFSVPNKVTSVSEQNRPVGLFTEKPETEESDEEN